MNPRKSKYDLLIMYDPKHNKILTIKWDGATNDVADWNHFDGKEKWIVRGNKYLQKVKTKYIELDRIHEELVYKVWYT